jgi:hypothetical protein
MGKAVFLLASAQYGCEWGNGSVMMRARLSVLVSHLCGM